MEGQIGAPPDSGEFATLWSATSALTEQLEVAQAQLQIVLTELHKTRQGLASAKADIQAIAKQTATATAHALQGQSDTGKAIAALNQLNAVGLGANTADHARRLREVERMSIRASQDINTTSTLVLDIIKGDLPVGKSNLPGGVAGTAAGGVSSAEFKGLKEALKVELCHLRQEISGGSVELLRIKFSGLEDAVVICAQHFPPNSYQCIPSMMVLMQMIGEDVISTTDAQARELHAVKVERTPT